MPGVPSGRACDGCRKQRKKCDEAKPSCSRCTRLQIACIGSGQQRFKFKEQSGCRMISSKSGQTTRFLVPRVQNEYDVALSIRTLSSKATLIASSLVKTMLPSTSLRYNLAYNYGGFLEHIPQRLGTNQALDTSVEALVCAHADICVNRAVGVKAIAKYSCALKQLRICLDDPVKACATETLGAVMLLLICQSFIGAGDSMWTGHCEGAAHLLKARQYQQPQDDFEYKLLLSLRGPVLFEGLFNHRIRFTSHEWKTLVENEFDGDTPEGQMMRCLARVPDFMQRGKKLRKGESEDPQLLHEARANYDTFKETLAELRGRITVVQENIPGAAVESAPIMQALAIFQRSYALALAIGIILNAVLSAIDIEDTELASESTYFSLEILNLAEPAARYHPLGSSYMGLCLIAAWVGTSEPPIKHDAEIAFKEFRKGFPQGNTVSTTALVKILDQTFQQLHLIDE